MPSATQWWVFLGAATLLAIVPGPGILYVLARSLRGGRKEGIRSAVGNASGALVHVAGATVGLSALLETSAVAFTVVKFVGAAYLIYLGVRALLERDTEHAAVDGERKRRSVFLQGFVTEALNPKTAVFFLAFLPQFVHPERGWTTLAFLMLGLVVVALTLSADLVVAKFAGPLGTRLATNRRWRRRQRVASGATLIGLGGALALSQP